MAVALVGSSSWASTLSSWPAGTAAGHLAVLVVVGDPPRNLLGWTLYSRDRAASFTFSDLFSAPYTAVYARQVPSDLSGTPGDLEAATTVDTVGRITVWSGAQDVGRVRKGSTDDSYWSIADGVTVAADGAAVHVCTATSTGKTVTNATVISGEGVGGPFPGAWISYLAYCQVAYDTTAVGGLQTVTFDGKVVSLELVPQSGPYAPTLYDPPAGSDVAVDTATTFQWIHNPVQVGGYQDAYRLQYRQVGTGTWSWLAADGTSAASETTVASRTQSAEMDASVLSTSVDYEWQVATREGVTQLWSDYSSSSTISGVTAPTLTVDAPTTVSEDLTPTVSWTPTTPQGSQTGFRVEVPEVGYDSGVILSSATSHTVPVQDWTNGGTYTARVTIQQTGGSWSSPTTRSFTLSWTAPTTPTISATATTTGNQVTVNGDSGDDIEIQATVDGGTTWTDVTTVAATGSNVIVTDVSARYGVAVTYRARALDTIDGVVLPSAWASSSAVTTADVGFHIIDSTDLASYVSPVLRAKNDSRVRESTVTYGLGGSRPMVDNSVFAGKSGSITVMVSSQAEELALLRLIGVDDDPTTSSQTFIVRWPPDYSGEAEPSITVAFVGGATVARLGPGMMAQRDVTLAWVEQ
jgi:hypothetical protein